MSIMSKTKQTETTKNIIFQRKTAAEAYMSTKREMFDKVEQLFHNTLNDTTSAKAKSQVFDPKLSTLTIERGYRVMAQLPTGKVKAISKNDLGSGKLMELIMDKYVLPNAKAQFDFLTKLRMADIYSNVYGSFFVMIDWDIKANGYIGPDMWLLNIRDVFPQVGAVSLEDSDYVIVRTWKPLSYFEGLAKQKGFKNIPEIVAKLKQKAGSKDTRDTNSTSQRETTQYPEATSANKSGFYEVLTQYEKDTWTDYCVDADLEFRSIKNPHDNGELPLVCKYSIPLLDDYMGMGDFERGASMQMAINSNWNLYFDGIKTSMFPPILVNKTNIASMSSIKWGPAEKWLVRNQINNAVQPLQLNPKGIETFNNTYQVANSALMNMFGTSDTATSAQVDPGMGKTPQALKMQSARENTRDNADRFYMEMFLKQVMTKMVNLISKKQSKAIVIRMFDEEIQELERSYPEIRDLFDEKSGKLRINTKNTGSTLFDYEMVSGSTFAADKTSQQENLSMLMNMFMKAQTPQGNLMTAQLNQEGFEFKFGEILKRLIANTGIQDWDKILVERTEDEQSEEILNQNEQMFMQAAQQMMQGQQAQPDMNAIPPQPQQMGQEQPIM